MNVGISCHALKFGGGMERYAMDLVDGLNALGVRPTVFAKVFDEQLPQYGRVDPVRIDLGWLPGKLRDHAFAALLKRRPERARVTTLIACNRILDADIAVCGGTHPGFLRAMGRAPRFFDRRMIGLERRYLQAARVVVAHSRLMEAELLEFFGLPREKIRVIYPPVAADRFQPVDAESRAALRRALGMPEDRVVFAFPSSSHERKGFPLLRAFFERTELPVTLAVAGRPVPTGLRNIAYLGFRKDIERVYQAADFAVLASPYEPFGLVGVESVLCGTPVLLARNIGCSEVIDAAAKEEFAANDLDELDAAVRRAVERVRAGRGRLSASRSHLRFPVDPVDHVRALLATVQARPPSAAVEAVREGEV